MRFALPLAILAVSTGAPFARWAAPAPPIAIAALRVLFASVLLFTVGHREISRLRSVPSRDRALIAFSGLLLGIHFGSWIASLSFTSTAASVALVCTNPIFAALFGTLLGDHVQRREVFGIAIAGIGCAVLAGGDWSTPPGNGSDSGEGPGSATPPPGGGSGSGSTGTPPPEPPKDPPKEPTPDFVNP